MSENNVYKDEKGSNDNSDSSDVSTIEMDMNACNIENEFEFL
jgi:hypothetical protein